jgi:hypothetical protein
VAGSCQHGNEPSGSIKFGEIPDQLSVLLASQEGLCSMELVIAVLYTQQMETYLLCNRNDCKGEYISP